ncbi:hypothetical protein CEXT_773611 [Caerostris extrusa]|uniref:Uncharacterized protein n=1 Tax=Caerostris extrusa TaxID=172846 RepID=A0AAV4TNT7_CAEEX|nr:hypothetical protein CEXT_773611 [Caerostris extrusa]
MLARKQDIKQEPNKNLESPVLDRCSMRLRPSSYRTEGTNLTVESERSSRIRLGMGRAKQKTGNPFF